MNPGGQDLTGFEEVQFELTEHLQVAHKSMEQQFDKGFNNTPQ